MSQANKGGAAPGGPSPFPNMNGGAPGFGFPPPPPGFGAAGPAGGQTFDTTAKAVGETLCTSILCCGGPCICKIRSILKALVD